MSGWVEPAHLRQLLTACVQANQAAALQTLDLHPGLLNERWEGMPFSIGNDQYIVRGSTPVLGAIRSGNDGLVVELLKRGADEEIRDSHGRNGLFVASVYNRLSIATILLGRGCDPNSRSKHWTALGVAAAYDNLPMCIFLLTRGADLYALMPGGERNTLQRYGEFARPPLSPAVLEERRALLQHAYDEGPQPNARWARRWPFMQVMVFNDFHPLLARQLILLALNPPLPPDASIPPVIISTVAQRRAFLNPPLPR
jgi:Ankyrin repeats (many copies)